MPVEPMKVKDMKFGRSDFGKRGKKAKPDLNASPRKSFNPNANGHKLTLVDVAAALKTVFFYIQSKQLQYILLNYTTYKKTMPYY